MSQTLFSNFHSSSNRKRKIWDNSEPILLDDFVPSSWGEEKMQQIAEKIGEGDLRYLKSIHDRYGLFVIEAAFGELQDIEREGREKIRHKPALLNALIKKRLAGDVINKKGGA